MKAIGIHGQPGVPELVWEEAPDVTYGPDEVLVDVWATAVNRADLSQARGSYPPPSGASEILGLEMAGVIREVGSDVDVWQPGDRVCALLPGGGYAEQVAVPAGMLLRLPDAWSYEQGAAVPEVWYTAFVNLFLEGQLQPGQVALIHAGASGVGTAAIQLVVAAGARAFVTVGSPEKQQTCRELGAELAINRKTEDFLEAVMAATGGTGVDVILDPVGADYLSRNVRALARYGRLVHIGLLSGAKAELDLGQVMGKRLHLIGSTLRSRPLTEKIAITCRFEQEVWPRLVSGKLRPIIDRVFPIADAQAAHEYVRANRNTGKVVLAVRPEGD
ncbi:MAG: NAD(P)H-quinone oxidoreductase [Chloroflexota bacterium]